MKQQTAITLGALWAVFFGFLFVFNPTELPIILLIIPFIVLFLALRLTWQTAEGLLRQDGVRSSRYRKERSNLFAAIVVAFLALASIGQLTVRDVSTVTLLAFLGYFYMTRNNSPAE